MLYTVNSQDDGDICFGPVRHCRRLLMAALVSDEVHWWGRLALSAAVYAALRLLMWSMALAIFYKALDYSSFLGQNHSLDHIRQLNPLHIMIFFVADAMSKGVTLSETCLVAQAHGASSLLHMHRWLAIALLSSLGFAIVTSFVLWSFARFLLPHFHYSRELCNSYAGYIRSITPAVILDSEIVCLSSYFLSFQDSYIAPCVVASVAISTIGASLFYVYSKQLNSERAVLYYVVHVSIIAGLTVLIALLFMLKRRLKLELLYPTGNIGKLTDSTISSFDDSDFELEYKRRRLLIKADDIINKITDSDDVEVEEGGQLSSRSGECAMNVEMTAMQHTPTDSPSHSGLSMAKEVHQYSKLSLHPSCDDFEYTSENTETDDSRGKFINVTIDFTKLISSTHCKQVFDQLTFSRYLYFLKQLALPNFLFMLLKSFSYLVFYLVLSIKVANFGILFTLNSSLLAFYGITFSVAVGFMDALAVRIGYHVGRIDSSSAQFSVKLLLICGFTFGFILGIAANAVWHYISRYLDTMYTFSDPNYESSDSFATLIPSPIIFVAFSVLLCILAALLAVVRAQTRMLNQLEAIFIGTWLIAIPIMFFVVLFKVDGVGTITIEGGIRRECSFVVASLWAAIFVGDCASIWYAAQQVLLSRWDVVEDNARDRVVGRL